MQDIKRNDIVETFDLLKKKFHTSYKLYDKFTK